MRDTAPRASIHYNRQILPFPRAPVVALLIDAKNRPRLSIRLKSWCLNVQYLPFSEDAGCITCYAGCAHR